MFGKKKDETKNAVVNEKIKNSLEGSEPVLSWKEMKALKNNDYKKLSERYNKSFVIKHKRTGMVVELRAASVMQAAGFIGWRPRHTILIKEKDLTEQNKDEKKAKEILENAKEVIESQKENSPALSDASDGGVVEEEK